MKSITSLALVWVYALAGVHGSGCVTLATDSVGSTHVSICGNSQSENPVLHAPDNKIIAKDFCFPSGLYLSDFQRKSPKVAYSHTGAEENTIVPNGCKTADVVMW